MKILKTAQELDKGQGISEKVIGYVLEKSGMPWHNRFIQGQDSWGDPLLGDIKSATIFQSSEEAEKERFKYGDFYQSLSVMPVTPEMLSF